MIHSRRAIIVYRSLISRRRILVASCVAAVVVYVVVHRDDARDSSLPSPVDWVSSVGDARLQYMHAFARKGACMGWTHDEVYAYLGKPVYISPQCDEWEMGKHRGKHNTLSIVYQESVVLKVEEYYFDDRGVADRIPFDQSRWLNEPNVRLAMASSVINSLIQQGMARHAVHQLLGKPDQIVEYGEKIAYCEQRVWADGTVIKGVAGASV